MLFPDLDRNCVNVGIGDSARKNLKSLRNDLSTLAVTTDLGQEAPLLFDTGKDHVPSGAILALIDTG